MNLIIDTGSSVNLILKSKFNITTTIKLEKILEVEKNCAFENVTAAELLASKFLSLIGKSTGDYELKKKLRKSDMSVEAKTEAIHEYMYEKLNDSPDTEDEKKFRHVEKRNKTHQRTNRPEHKVQNSKL